MILIKCWENHINIYATFVEDVNVEDMAEPYEFSKDDTPDGMYDLILHLT
jgi:hypothetical protein